MRIGHGYDVHQLAEGLPLILGGITIPHHKGLLGHSDADVLTHAIIDALVGALALGNIGTFFPDTDAQYKGISSIVLLDKVMATIKEKGYKIGNIDCVIAAQLPKLNPYINDIREKLATHLNTTIDNISIKPTTTERLGFEGEEKGISAHAVVLLLQS
jgi:2-C-methyl-D-erythritol 2,4-cyclodiphosphate synthase